MSKRKEKKERKSTSRILLKLLIEDLPPSINHVYFRAYRGVYRSPAAREYQNKVVEIATPQRTREWPYLGRVSFLIEFTAINKRRWDIDNRVKVLQDCLELIGVIKDDSQIDELSVKRFFNLGKEKTKSEKTKIILRKLD